MTDATLSDDPDPLGLRPAGPLFVPVRSGLASCAIRLFRTPLGRRTAVGFTTQERLGALLGQNQAWIRLAEPAMRAMVEPLGVATVTVDPQFAAAGVNASEVGAATALDPSRPARANNSPSASCQPGEPEWASAGRVGAYGS
jgi:hypothetical protein